MKTPKPGNHQSLWGSRGGSRSRTWIVVTVPLLSLVVGVARSSKPVSARTTRCRCSDARIRPTMSPSSLTMMRGWGLSLLVAMTTGRSAVSQATPLASTPMVRASPVEQGCADCVGGVMHVVEQVSDFRRSCIEVVSPVDRPRAR